MKRFFHIIILIIGSSLLIQCGQTLKPTSGKTTGLPAGPDSENAEGIKLPAPQDTTVRALNEYCRACHGLGEMRFIYGEDPGEIWNYIFNNKAPISKKLWSEAIYEVLNYPTDTPPDFEDMLDGPARDWMPKGAKRLHMANDIVDGVPVRETILKTIEEQMNRSSQR